MADDRMKNDDRQRNMGGTEKDKNLNQKGRKKYTLVAIDALDRKTINEVGDILKRVCPGVKISASRMPVININTDGTKRQ